MANYIISNNKAYFQKIGYYNYCDLKDMILPEKIAVDTETTGLIFYESDMFCMQIGNGIGQNYLIDLETIPFSDVIPFIKDKTLVFVNACFDLKFFYKNNFFPEKVRDAMIASQVFYNGDETIYNHGFQAIMKRELDVYIDKNEQKSIHLKRISTKEAIQYCFLDVDRLLELEEVLFKKLERMGSEKAYLFNCDFLLAQTYLEMCGLPIDEDLWKEKMKQDSFNSLKYQEEIREYIFDNCPPFQNNQIDMFSDSKRVTCQLSSPVQMIPVFEYLKINTWDEKEKKKGTSEAIISKTKHPFVDLWLKYKESEHRVSTFGDKVLKQVKEGYLYSNFRTIADTGRMISRAGSVNFLNFPRDKETRSCFVAKKGNRMIGCDYDAQEARILAFKSQDLNSKLNVLQDRDSHSLLAREAFPALKHLSDNEIKKNHGDKRQIGKVINFACSFGGTGYTISTQLMLPPSEGDRLYNVYRNLYADVFVWGETILRKGIKSGYIESEEGFKLKLPFYDRFKELEILNKDIDWTLYKRGKVQYKAEKEAQEKKELYMITDHSSYQYYKQHYKNVSRFFQIKSSWTNLCLNFPIQSAASFQSKRACIKLFERIKSEGDLWKVRISNFIYDEIILECKDELVEKYRIILQDIMKDSADYYIGYDKEITMSCTANVAGNWYDTK